MLYSFLLRHTYSERGFEMLEYTSPEGYTGQLYGGGIYRIIDPYGKEVFSTKHCLLMTEEELKKDVDEFPKLLKRLTERFEY